MSLALPRSAVIAAGLLAGGVLGLLTLTEPPPEPDLPRVKTSVATDGEVDESKFEEHGPTVASPQPDRGNSRDVAVVKRTVPQLLTVYRDSMAMPSETADRRETLESRAALVHRSVTQVWVPAVVDRKSRETVAAIASVVDDESYRAYRASRFVVSRWEGVDVSGHSASVVFTGYSQYLLPTVGWVSEMEAQYQIQLSRTASFGHDGWRIASYDDLIVGDQG